MVAAALAVKTHLNLNGLNALPEVFTTEHAQQMIDEINSKQSTWVAGHNARFTNASRNFIMKHMGTILKGGPKLPVLDIPTASAIPAEFDARTAWANCPSTSEIRDQSACGSCWAFGAAEAMSDRICIASKGALASVRISTEDLMTCCHTCGMGCDGGYPSAAWSYFKQTGLVTGDLYGTTTGCQPYALAPCDHHTTGKYSPCGSEGPTPACSRTCIPAYGKAYATDKHFGATAYSVPSNVEKIQTEIMTNGPVEGAFEVYADFVTYKSGVYKHTTGQQLGGHAIKILGWGTEDGTDYWLVANSWNEDWGDQGYFKIARGTDECGIEDGIVAGLPKVN